MAIAVRSSSSTGNDQSVDTLAVDVPTGAQAGDVVVVVVSRWETFTPKDPITVPSGFTHVGTFHNGTGLEDQDIYWKRLTDADTGTYTFSWVSSDPTWSHIRAICLSGGATSGDPIEATNSWNGTAGTFGTTTVTVATEAALLWFAYNDSSGTHTPPTDFTELHDHDCGSVAYRIPGAAGTYSASDATVTSSSSSVATLVAVKPAGAAGQTVAVGQVSEQNIAQTITPRKIVPVGQVVETDFAQPILQADAIKVAVGLVTTVETPQSITPRKIVPVGQVVETDTALAATRAKLRAVGFATEVDLAQPIGKRKRKGVGQVSEVDLAQGVAYVASVGHFLCQDLTLNAEVGVSYSLESTKDELSVTAEVCGR